MNWCLGWECYTFQKINEISFKKVVPPGFIQIHQSYGFNTKHNSQYYITHTKIVDFHMKTIWFCYIIKIYITGTFRRSQPEYILD